MMVFLGFNFMVLTFLYLLAWNQIEFGSANGPLECLLSCFLNMAKSFSLVLIFLKYPFHIILSDWCNEDGCPNLIVFG